MARQAILCNCGGELDVFVRTRFYTGMQYGDSTDATAFLGCTRCSHVFMVHINGDGAIDPEEIRPYAGCLTKDELREWMPQESGNYYPDSHDNRVKRKIAEIEQGVRQKYYCAFEPPKDGSEVVIMEVFAISDEEARELARKKSAAHLLWVAKKV